MTEEEEEEEEEKEEEKEEEEEGEGEGEGEGDDDEEDDDENRHRRKDMRSKRTLTPPLERRQDGGGGGQGYHQSYQHEDLHAAAAALGDRQPLLEDDEGTRDGRHGPKGSSELTEIPGRANMYDGTFSGANKRLGWFTLGGILAALRDVLFLIGSAFSGLGNTIINFGNIVGGFGKEAHKFLIKLRARFNQTHPHDGRREGVISGPEKIFGTLAGFFAFLIAFTNRLVEAVIKTVGFVLFLVGEIFKSPARFFGWGRDRTMRKGPVREEDQKRRKAKHDIITTANIVYNYLPQHQASQHHSAWRIASASILKQFGLLLQSPGRLVFWLGHTINKISKLIDNAMMIVSNLADRTLWTYVTDLHKDRGDMDGIKHAKAIIAIMFAGLVGGILKYIPKLIAFVPNKTIGLAGFAFEKVGELAKLPGQVFFYFGQKISGDPKQDQMDVDKDINLPLTDTEFDPEQIWNIKDKAIRTYWFDGWSKKRTIKQALKEYDARVDYYLDNLDKVSEQQLEGAIALATEAAHGAIAQNAMGFYYGYGEGHGKHPYRNGPLISEINSPNVCEIEGEPKLRFRKPSLTQGPLSFFWRNPVLTKFRSLSSYEKTKLRMIGAHGSAGPNTVDINDGYKNVPEAGERRGLMGG